MNKKITITDIFTDTEKSTDNNIISESENRMVELLESFEKKNEIIKKDKVKAVDSTKLEEEKIRLKSIARVDEGMNSGKFSGHVPAGMALGQTVNTVFDNENQANQVNSFVDNSNNNPNSNKPYNPNYTYLQDNEALRLSISRTLNSGAPINDLGFYEEINWILNGLGFNSKSPLDIKQAILKMIKD